MTLRANSRSAADKVWPSVRSTLTVGLAAGLLGASALAAAGMQDAASPERLVMQGRVDEAVAALQTTLKADPRDAKAHLLLCRAYYSEDLARQAMPECEAAVSGLPGSSEAHDWAGRVYGAVADHAGAFGGLKLAGRVREAFEAAARLDAKNADAINDLSEFYVSAPGIVGGGTDKALALADRVQATVPQSAHRIRALVAQHEKDYAKAETEFRAATAVANKPDAWADLAQFYAARQQPDKAVDAVRHCLAADRAVDASVVDAVYILDGLHREPKLAESTLRAYLERGSKSDSAPAFRVHVELGKLLAANGDAAGAKAEYRKALGLAAAYAPAKKALGGS